MIGDMSTVNDDNLKYSTDFDECFRKRRLLDQKAIVEPRALNTIAFNRWQDYNRFNLQVPRCSKTIDILIEFSKLAET